MTTHTIAPEMFCDAYDDMRDVPPFTDEEMERPAPSTTAAKITQMHSTGSDMGNNVRAVEGVAYDRYVSPRNPGPNPLAVHPWERCGLGVAPYRCVGAAVVTYQACRDAPVQPGSSCDYCGQAIMNVYSVQAKCGSVFKVGCDCVAKTCSDKEGVRTVIEHQDRKRRNAQAKAARDRRDDANKAALKTIREENAERLAAMPHPSAAPDKPWFAAKTALDWLDFMMRACGSKGRAELIKSTRAMLA